MLRRRGLLPVADIKTGRVRPLPRGAKPGSSLPAMAGVIFMFGILGCAFAQTASDAQPHGLMRWIDPATAPFIPIPEIDVDPYSGTTLGLIPTWLITDDGGQIHKIIAPDVLYNPYFGVGARARIFSFPSDDTQWSAVGGMKQRVESEFDYEYMTGRLRQNRWTFSGSVVYDRSGTPRFYGIGNRTRPRAESNFTFQQMFAQTTLGWNLTHELQISYTLRARDIDVQLGTIARIPTIQRRFPTLAGLGDTHETLHRLAVIYDTRDDPTVPTQGGQYIVYAGAAAGHGIFNASLYRVAGVDLRHFWTPDPGNTIAAHMALRYMPGTRAVPFWALSNLGGDNSVVGEAQPLRGYGTGRFNDRDSFSASLEYRKRVFEYPSFNHLSVEFTPFVDIGEVYSRRRFSLARLHRVLGVGFRGVASPYVVGYLDVGYGREGAVVFTGINYPF